MNWRRARLCYRAAQVWLGTGRMASSVAVRAPERFLISFLSPLIKLSHGKRGGGRERGLFFRNKRERERKRDEKMARRQHDEANFACSYAAGSKCTTVYISGDSSFYTLRFLDRCFFEHLEVVV